MTKVPLVRLADGLSVPAAELATKVVAALGMRGSGKSNVMAVIAEQLLAAGIQVVVLDDVGIWFSLRLKPDGKTKSGLEIPVLGGRHGDIPLLPTAGEVVAKSLAETGSSAVLDISGFRKGERARFAAAFAETLFRAKQHHPGPCFVILEESQRWVPQVIRFKGEGEERMLGAFMEIAEVGRNYGIGLGLLSQRPQKVHKEVLNLTELLFAFQTNGVLERKALAEWVQETGAENRAEVHNELPSLPTGEALVWSPAWLRMFKRCKLPKKTTYDAGATPLAARAQVKTRSLELGELSKAMAAVIEEAKGSDPKALRAEVARLTRELASADRRAPKVIAPTAPAVPRGLEQALRRSRQLLAGFGADLAGLVDKRTSVLLGRLDEALRMVAAASELAAVAQKDAHNKGIVMAKEPRPQPGDNPTARKLRAELNARDLGKPVAGGNGEWRPGGGALRSLQALASTLTDGLTWRQVATLAGMKATGGGFNNIKSALRTHACVEERGEKVRLTEVGRVLAGHVEGPASGKDLVEFWKRKLPGKAGAMLEVVVAQAPITREALAEAVEMAPGGGGFNNYLSALRTNGLVVDDPDGLFPAEVFLQ
jgi:hypothetical protein